MMMIALMSDANGQELRFQQQRTIRETSRGTEHDAYIMSKVLKV